MRYLFFVLLILITFFLTSIYFFKNNNLNKKRNINNFQYVISSRFFHPINENDNQSTFEIIKLLKPNRIDWTYIKDKSILDVFFEMNIPYSLTMNPQIPDSLEFSTGKYHIKDYNNELFIVHYMKEWKLKNPYWGCVNNPMFYNLFIEHGIMLGNLNPYAIMVDDAMFNYTLKWENKVGCFCDYCELKFQHFEGNSFTKMEIEQLKSEIKNSILQKKAIGNNQKRIARLYLNFQKKSVVNFLKKWKNQMKTKFPNLIFLVNNFNGDWNEIYQVFDGGISELQIKYVNESDLDSLYNIADSLNKSQIFSAQTDDIKLHFRLMEYNANNNRESLLPWDVFVPKKSNRYYAPIDLLKNKIKELN